MVAPLAVLAGASIFTTMLGAGHNIKSEKDTRRYNLEVAREDVKLIDAESKQKQRLIRRQGARNTGVIQARAAAAGVSISSGSALDTVLEQVRVNAENEFNTAFEAEIAKTRTLNAAQLGAAASQNRQTGYVLGAIGDSLNTATTYFASR